MSKSTEYPDDPFFIGVMADFIRHRPEKLVDSLKLVYQAGYRVGLISQETGSEKAGDD